MKNLYRDVIVWDGECDAARRCDVQVDDGIITAVSPRGTFEYGSAYEGHGKTALIPGFVNAHGHAAMTLLRGLGEDLPLMDWLTKRIWPIENKLNGDLVYTGTQQAILEMLSTGTTCFTDMYFFMDRTADAALDAGIRAALCRGLMGDGEKFKQSLYENLKLAEDYNGARGLITVQLGPHAPYTVSVDDMKVIAAVAKEKNLAVQLHWLETKTEWSISEGSKHYDLPEELLSDTGLIDVKHLILAHCVWIDKERMPFYARPNVTAVHNPKSNIKLGSGFAPVAKMREDGVNVAIGTDGASSNNRLDMWEELRFAELVQKGLYSDPTVLPAEEVLRMATVYGAKALGFDNVGLIKEGYAADFMLIDLDKPHYNGWTLENLAGCLVYAGSSADVKTTVVAGETLYHMGTFPKLDAEKIMKDAAEARRFLTA